MVDSEVKAISERLLRVEMSLEESRREQLRLEKLIEERVPVWRFRPVEVMAWGTAGLIGSGFVGALVALVIQGAP